MNRTEYNEMCQSRGYIGLIDEDNTYMKGNAVVCDYVAGSAIVYPHCVICVSDKTMSEHVITTTLNEIVATDTEHFIESLDKFDLHYKNAQQIIRENKMEKDFEDEEDEDM